MRRVAVTGLGIVSSIGNNANEVLASLRDARSGIDFAPDYAEHAGSRETGVERISGPLERQEHGGI